MQPVCTRERERERKLDLAEFFHVHSRRIAAGQEFRDQLSSGTRTEMGRVWKSRTMRAKRLKRLSLMAVYNESGIRRSACVCAREPAISQCLYVNRNNITSIV